jgi:antitoxin component YwqK of YwqJK toxin-antitoxin module
MKWYYYIILLLTLACKENLTVTEDEIGAEIFYMHGSYKPYSGKCRVYYNQTTIVKEQFTYRNGFLNGESLTWYKNGQLRRKGCYRKGQISGKWIFYDENGSKIIEANYHKDILQGDYIAHYSNGRIKEKGRYSENKPTGKWAYYNESGQLTRSISR